MDKDKIVIDKIRVLIEDNQIRLFKIVELFKALSKMPNYFTFKKQYLHLFACYIKNYSRLMNIHNIKELYDTFSEFVGHKIGRLVLINEIKYKPEDVFVKFETYKIFYYKIWPEYVNALSKKYIEGENIGVFKYNVPKKKINSIYTEGNANSNFGKEIVSLTSINGFDVVGINNEDSITIEMEI